MFNVSPRKFGIDTYSTGWSHVIAYTILDTVLAKCKFVESCMEEELYIMSQRRCSCHSLSLRQACRLLDCIANIHDIEMVLQHSFQDPPPSSAILFLMGVLLIVADIVVLLLPVIIHTWSLQMGTRRATRSSPSKCQMH
jgi:hypothetical protein